MRKAESIFLFVYFRLFFVIVVVVVIVFTIVHVCHSIMPITLHPYYHLTLLIKEITSPMLCL